MTDDVKIRACNDQEDVEMDAGWDSDIQMWAMFDHYADCLGPEYILKLEAPLPEWAEAIGVSPDLLYQAIADRLIMPSGQDPGRIVLRMRDILRILAVTAPSVLLEAGYQPQFGTRFQSLVQWVGDEDTAKAWLEATSDKPDTPRHSG